jgi:hypothetical protein
LRIANGLRISHYDVDDNRMFSRRPPPFALGDYTVLIQVRDVARGGEVCFSSSGVLTDASRDSPMSGPMLNLANNFVSLPAASTDGLFNSSGGPQHGAYQALALDVVLLRRDGAAHTLAGGPWDANPDAGLYCLNTGNAGRSARFVAFGASLTPWIDFEAQEADYAAAFHDEDE